MASRSTSKRRRFPRRVTWVGLLAALIAAAVRFHPAPHASALPTQAVVRHVIDGDTVEIDDGRHLRYLGIDTPEMRKHVGDRWIEDPQPFAREATALNRQLVEGKTVRLEYDVQTHDKYGRLLAYVYEEKIMVNEELLRQGVAQTMTIPPNVKYAERFRMLAREAREAGRGLWSRVTSMGKRRAK